MKAEKRILRLNKSIEGGKCMDIPYKELTLSEFEKLISDTKSSILCGNGLSINFDNRLSMNNLGKSLYNAHCTWKEHSNYKIISDAAFKEKIYIRGRNIHG
jgi:hypothetical protein